MREIVLDASLWRTPESAHDALSAALEFPAYYGRNLDALHDMLTDLRDVRLTLNHVEEMRDHLGSFAAAMLRAMMDADAENPGWTLILR